MRAVCPAPPSGCRLPLRNYCFRKTKRVSPNSRVRGEKCQRWRTETLFLISEESKPPEMSTQKKAARLFEGARVPMPKVPQRSPDGFVHSIREAGSPVNTPPEKETPRNIASATKITAGSIQIFPQNQRCTGCSRGTGRGVMICSGVQTVPGMASLLLGIDLKACDPKNRHPSLPNRSPHETGNPCRSTGKSRLFPMKKEKQPVLLHQLFLCGSPCRT